MAAVNYYLYADKDSPPAAETVPSQPQSNEGEGELLPREPDLA